MYDLISGLSLRSSRSRNHAFERNSREQTTTPIANPKADKTWKAGSRGDFAFLATPTYYLPHMPLQVRSTVPLTRLRTYYWLPGPVWTVKTVTSGSKSRFFAQSCYIHMYKELRGNKLTSSTSGSDSVSSHSSSYANRLSELEYPVGRSG